MLYDLIMRGPNGFTRTLKYDPHHSLCFWADTGEALDLTNMPVKKGDVMEWEKAFPVSPNNPVGKIRNAKHIKIQLGLKCNYDCSYCNQRSQPHDGEGNIKQVERFLTKLPTWLDIADGDGVTIEFWGGEPFVYWKILKPLAEGVRSIYPKASFNIITNGSLLDKEKVDWLNELKFNVGISHDGPAYEAGRGQDPLLIPEQRRWIKYAYNVLSQTRSIGFNCVLSAHNVSLDAVRKYIAEHLAIPVTHVPLTTEEFILPYEDGGVTLSLLDDDLATRTRHTVFDEIIYGYSMGVNTVENKIRDFMDSIVNQRPASSLGQKCGMDRKDNIAFDLNGNVLTCQNTSPLTKHRIGHMEAFDHIKLNTAYHWSVRNECKNCPVLQLCRGACLFLEDDLWISACNNSFNYNLAVLAGALFFATKLVLVEIKGETIRVENIQSTQVIDPVYFEQKLFALHQKKLQETQT
jgi:uncharacterized protein